AAVGVVAELVHRGRRGRQQHGVAGTGEPSGSGDHRVHQRVGVVGVDDLDRDVGRVLGQGGGDEVTVGADQHGAGEPVADVADEVAVGGALGQSPGDPHDALEGEQRGAGGVRVGGLRVV